MREESALTVKCVSDGINHCRIGFLSKAYVPHAKVWDGALCQVVFVGSAEDPSSLVIRHKYHHYCGYTCCAVILALPCRVEMFKDIID
jgi:hypothetical protein